MTRNEALRNAQGNLNAFRVADYRFLAGTGKRPDPRFYGISGSTEQPGNMITIDGHTFHQDEVARPTFPVHAGF